MQTEEVKDAKKVPAPPYVSYRTVTNFLDWLKEVGVPSVLDRSAWGHKFSGATGSQLMSALRFLGFTDDKDVPSQTFENLVKANKEGRQAIMQKTLDDAYGGILGDIDLTKATQAQLRNKFKGQGIDGGTIDKAMVFFTRAAKDANVTLSGHLTRRRTPNRSVRTPKSKHAPKDEKNASTSTALTSENTLLRGLVEQIPEAGKTWSHDDREKWIATAKSIFDLVFKDE